VKEADPKMHSAEHLLTAALMKLHNTGRPFTTHLEKKKSKADYRFSRPLAEPEERALEAEVNNAICRNIPVTEKWVSRGEASKLFDLSRLPESAGETIRIIEMGDYDACPCSGTHVQSTKEIGVFRIISSSFENGALRVRFKLG
jgi:misacylated tRNA(Ala) deacylase